jgi:hypothetical protein
MTHPHEAAISLAELRHLLGLPADGAGELLIVIRSTGDPVPAPDEWVLALGDWPEQWSTEPKTGPRFLVMLRGQVIVTVEDIDPGGWGRDDGEPAARAVPVRGTSSVTAVVGGRLLTPKLTVGWDEPAERWALG